MGSSPLSGGERTLPLTVHNTAFLLDRLGQDCHPLQFLRELTQNSIEAIRRTPERKGEIIWDVEWSRYELTGIYKLCITDTGDGMSGDDMVRYINQLSSSSSEQSFVGNYGVGAKIAAATRNPAGLIYLSWRKGRGAMIHLWRDPASLQYGLRQFERPDGSFGHFGEVEDTLKPTAIRDHGTVVVLLGNDEDADTMQPPAGVGSPSRWIAKCLNTRYLRIPEGVTIRAREGWEHPRTDKDRNLLRRVTGQEPYLAEHSTSRGQVDLTGATAHWWILQDEPALSQNSGFIESSGHIAALYKDELYERWTASAGRARLQQFGVLFGHNRVVIYVEPKERRVVTNTARTQLLIDSDPLPWDEWAADFRDKMPKEIQRHTEAVAAAATATDHQSSIRERLKQILDLYRVSRYRPTSTGDTLVDPQSRTRGGQSAPTEREPSTSTSKTSGREGGAAGSVYSLFLKADGTPGQAVRPDVFPKVQWVSAKDGTREPGDIEDRAARFLIDQNMLFVNADFRVFTDMATRWSRQFQDRSAVLPAVQDAVHGWFEQALVETVIGIQALKDAKEWSKADITKALSEEALTAAVMQRYHVNNAVKRELGSKFGKLQLG